MNNTSTLPSTLPSTTSSPGLFGNLIKDGKLNLFRMGVKEGFDASLLPDDSIKIMIRDFKLNVSSTELRRFISNLDKHRGDLSKDDLDNRINVLTQFRSFLEQSKDEIIKRVRDSEPKVDSEGRIDSESLPQILMRKNIEGLIKLWIHLISMVIAHSERLKAGPGAPGKLELFTLEPFTSSMRQAQKGVLNKYVLSKYGLTFDEVVQVMERFDTQAKDLTSEQRLSRLRVLVVLRQLLEASSGYMFPLLISLNLNPEDITSDGTLAIKEDNNRAQVELINLAHSVASYVTDVFLFEIYASFGEADITGLRVASFFQKFLDMKNIYWTGRVDRDMNSLQNIIRNTKDQIQNKEVQINEEQKRTGQMTVGMIMVIISCIIMTIMYFMKGPSS